MGFYENEIEKIISGAGKSEEEEEYQEYAEESQKFAFSDSEFGPNDKDPSGLKSIGPTLSKKTRNLQWPKMSDIADMGRAYFIESIGDPENPAESFWIKKVIQGDWNNLEFLKYFFFSFQSIIELFKSALILVISHPDLLNRIFNPAFERHFKHGIYSFKFFKVFFSDEKSIS